MGPEAVSDARPATPTPAAPPAASPRPRRVDRYELGLLIVFAALSLWVLGLDVWQVLARGRSWTGTDGVYIVDQMQYLAWIRSASEHLLIANLFVLRPTPADYFQPAVVLSAALTKLGVPATVALLVWKPVAVAGLFFAVRAYVHRVIVGLWARRVALTLALLFGSVTVVYGSFTVLGDLFPVFLSWGYTFGLLSLVAMVAAIVLLDRDRRRGRPSPWPPLLGAGAALLHPWHGELLALLIIGAELSLWRRGRRGPVIVPLATLLAIGVALLYYALLGHNDLSWKLAREASKHSFSFWPIALYLLPLAIPALLGYRGRSRTFLEAATRAWPVASLALFALSATALGATPLHAFEGITIPLALLAVRGVTQVPPRFVRRVRLAVTSRLGPGRGRPVVAGVILLATVPGAAMQLKSGRELAGPTQDNANFVQRDELHALDYLASRRTPGGVLTRSYLGAMVPSRTGRHVLVGDCLWSEPDCLPLTDIAKRLFTGALAPTPARAFVATSHARFALGDCGANFDLRPILGPLILRVNRFGCATVYELRSARLT